MLSCAEVAATRDWPVERATVVAVDEHSSLLGCGRGGGPQLDVSWRSSEPPPGLPSAFRDIGACVDVQVGDVVEVVRVPHTDGDAEVYVQPVRSYRQARQDMLAGAVIGAVLTLGILMGRHLLLHSWALWRGRRHGVPRG